MLTKNTQSIPRHLLKQLLAIARGDQEPDWVLQNVTVLDLIEGDLYQTNIAFYQQWIAGLNDNYTSSQTIDGTGLTIVPGFIDGHTHLESSLMNPFEFERITLPLGT
ncbi:MAG TPA: adenine deaminase, partial [Candidatus Nitrosotenuis sp.]|nr:adenine deaminase [Candidatus Nitrosotenuis sp.]